MLTVPAYVLGWLELVAFVSILSIWALVESSFTSWRADDNPELKHVEEAQVRIEQKLDLLLERTSTSDPTS